MVLSRVPNPQHISLQPHSVCSHLDYLTLLTDDLVPKNKEEWKKYIYPAHGTFIYIFDNNLGVYKNSLSKIEDKHIAKLLRTKDIILNSRG